MINFTHFLKNKQRGQAMTEMLVASAFVAIPLFLIIPTVGKYIDMKHAAIDSARYTAWERTVYFNKATLGNQPTGFEGFKSGLFPVKSDALLAAEAQLRIFNSAEAPIKSSTKVARVFWTYYDGSPMYAPLDAEKPGVKSNQGTPDATSVASTAVGAIGAAVAFITGIIPFGSSQFDAINMRGATVTRMRMSVEETPRYLTTLGDNSGQRAPLIDVGSNFKMRADAGVLSQTWSAGGGKHLQSQAQALAPTKLIGDVFNAFSIPIPGVGNTPLQDVMAVALLTPELSQKNLVFGQMDIDALPRDKFAEPEFPAADDANKPLCNKKGYCRE
jgi:hypothetical protein